MGRLINADALLQEFETENAAHNTDLWHITGIKAFIENAPTAYDTEKVVAELEKVKMNYFLTIANTGGEKMDIAYGYASDALNKAIEIVRKGGVDHE